MTPLREVQMESREINRRTVWLVAEPIDEQSQQGIVDGGWDHYHYWDQPPPSGKHGHRFVFEMKERPTSAQEALDAAYEAAKRELDTP